MRSTVLILIIFVIIIVLHLFMYLWLVLELLHELLLQVIVFIIINHHLLLLIVLLLDGKLIRYVLILIKVFLIFVFIIFHLELMLLSPVIGIAATSNWALGCTRRTLAWILHELGFLVFFKLNIIVVNLIDKLLMTIIVHFIFIIIHHHEVFVHWHLSAAYAFYLSATSTMVPVWCPGTSLVLDHDRYFLHKLEQVDAVLWVTIDYFLTLNVGQIVLEDLFP